MTDEPNTEGKGAFTGDILLMANDFYNGKTVLLISPGDDITLRLARTGGGYYSIVIGHRPDETRETMAIAICPEAPGALGIMITPDETELYILTKEGLNG